MADREHPGGEPARDAPGERPDPGVPLRRLPASERNAIRVDRILDAAGHLVAERGYEKMTTSHVALRAGVSPGLLYQFFADKRAIVHALATRNLDRYLGQLERASQSCQAVSWDETADAAMDVFVTMCREDPGFRVVRFGDVADVRLLGITADNDSVLADRLGALLTGPAGPAGGPTRLTLIMAIKIADALVRLAFAESPSGDQGIIDHAKRLIRIHLDLCGPAAGP
jgi:AcrR family transcriptional regulator